MKSVRAARPPARGRARHTPAGRGREWKARSSLAGRGRAHPPAPPHAARAGACRVGGGRLRAAGRPMAARPPHARRAGGWRGGRGGGGEPVKTARNPASGDTSAAPGQHGMLAAAARAHLWSGCRRGGFWQRDFSWPFGAGKAAGFWPTACAVANQRGERRLWRVTAATGAFNRRGQESIRLQS